MSEILRGARADQKARFMKLANNRAGADGGMTVLFHAGRACPAAAQHGRWAAVCA